MADGELRSLFLHECGQQLDEIDTLLLDAESAGELTADAVNTLFRLAHTLKGSAAMMGYDALARVTHRAEDLLQLARDRVPAGLDERTRSLVLARCLDFSAYFREALGRIADGAQTGEDADVSRAIAELTDALRRGEAGDVSRISGAVDSSSGASRGETASKASPNVFTPEKRSDPARFTRYRVYVKPCPMTALRAYLMLRAVEAVSSECYTLPAELQNHPELGEQIAREGFELGLVLKPGFDEEKARALIGRQAYFDRLEKIAVPARKAEPMASVRQSSVNRLIDRTREMMSLRAELEKHLRDAGVCDARSEKLLAALDRVGTELGGGLGEMGMTEARTLFLRMQRLARDLLAERGKRAEVTMSGGGLLLDKSVLEAASEMLLHVVRNAVDHGIEPENERVAAGKDPRGLIRLEAEKRDGRLRVSVSDDGRGVRGASVLAVARAKGMLDRPDSEYTRREIFAFLTRSGFSTQKEVTETSGRGVGMDAVLHMCEKMGGRMEIESEEGRGTTVSFDLPLSLAATDALRLTGERVFYVPARHVERIVTRENAAESDGMLSFGGESYRPLHPALCGPGAYCVLFSVGGRRCFVCCREVGACGSYLTRPLPEALARLFGAENPYAGCVRDALGGSYLLINVEKLAARE